MRPACKVEDIAEHADRPGIVRIEFDGSFRLGNREVVLARPADRAVRIAVDNKRVGFRRDQLIADKLRIIVSVRQARSGATNGSTLRSALSVTPRHEFVQLCDFVVCDAGQRVCKPGLRINAVEFGRFDQRVGDGS